MKIKKITKNIGTVTVGVGVGVGVGVTVTVTGTGTYLRGTSLGNTIYYSQGASTSRKFSSTAPRNVQENCECCYGKLKRLGPADS